jgi:hypothetical protein
MVYAKIKVEEIIDHLSTEFTAALDIAVNRTIPNAKYDKAQLFYEFKNAIRNRCGTWEKVPDKYIDA